MDSNVNPGGAAHLHPNEVGTGAIDVKARLDVLTEPVVPQRVLKSLAGSQTGVVSGTWFGQIFESKQNCSFRWFAPEVVGRTIDAVLLKALRAALAAPAAEASSVLAGHGMALQAEHKNETRWQQDSGDESEQRFSPRALQLASGWTLAVLYHRPVANSVGCVSAIDGGGPRLDSGFAAEPRATWYPVTGAVSELAAYVATLMALNDEYTPPATRWFDVLNEIAAPDGRASLRWLDLVEFNLALGAAPACAPESGMPPSSLPDCGVDTVEVKRFLDLPSPGHSSGVISELSPDKGATVGDLIQARTVPSTDRVRKPNRKQVTLEMRESVVRLDDVSRSQEAAALLEKKSATQVFLDAAQKPASKVLEEAMGLARVLDHVRGLVKPIVVGPLDALTPEMDRRFAKRSIRTTGFTFDEYVKDIKEHCEFVDKVRGEHEQRRRVS